MDQGFQPHQRLRNGRDYGRVMHKQQKAAGRHLVVLLAPRRLKGGAIAPARLGIMVSTKVSKLAVRRHQLKRWVRELFRTELQHDLAGWDVCVLFRSDPPADGRKRLDDDIRALLRKALVANDGPRRPRPGNSPGKAPGKAP